MWEDTKGNQFFHGQYFINGFDSVLGETANKTEIFLLNKCEDISLQSVVGRVIAVYTPPTEDWANRGGEEQLTESYDVYTYKFQYDPVTARFTEYKPSDDFQICDSCEALARLKEQAEWKVMGEPIDTLNNKSFYHSVKKGQFIIHLGDSVYLKPNTVKLTVKSQETGGGKQESDSRYLDEITYPELYRKPPGSYVKGIPSSLEPYQIGRVIKIYQSNSGIGLKIGKYYRPENLKDELIAFVADRNLLFWTNETADVPLDSVEGLCNVVYKDTIDNYEEYIEGYDNFYYQHAYNSKLNQIEEVPHEAYSEQKKNTNKFSEQKVDFQPLDTLDIFAGAGGLTEGLHQSGICRTKWAIEFDITAAQAFKLNYPEAVVFTEDCNDTLELIKEGKETNGKGKILPRKGQVQFLVGGPPCQGFSGMNRFSSREYSNFKNSLIVTYLSYCDYFRPRFFLLENVKNFISFKSNIVLRMVLRSLIEMGYQCCFGVRQAGQFGVPQSRRRAFILAAAPGELLPHLPEPTHIFPGNCSTLTVDNITYQTGLRNESAPFRNVTVRDALSDLPPIKNGAKVIELPIGEPKSDFQRRLRKFKYMPTITDHICKEMSPLVYARICHIPKAPGSDWRDLPNMEVKLKDGTVVTPLLLYTHDDIKRGLNRHGGYRGVCFCATGGVCRQEDKQDGTLIPWCLPHTGNRHNQWAGLYGRLEWNGYFSTTVTNPEPMGKQGQVLHPEQDRVVSVRECARSQGFPDTHHFVGDILDKHRQIGNAVPPPLSRAIGYEIKKVVIKREMK